MREKTLSVDTKNRVHILQALIWPTNLLIWLTTYFVNFANNIVDLTNYSTLLIWPTVQLFVDLTNYFADLANNFVDLTNYFADLA